MTLNVPAGPSGLVRVGGTAGNDAIVVGQSGADLLVSLNGVTVSDDVPIASVSQVLVFGRGGADTIDMSGYDGVGTVDGGGAPAGSSDRLIVRKDANQVLTNTAFTASDGTNLTLANLTAASLSGGASANTFNLSGWTGTANIDGGGGSDTLIGPTQTNAWEITGGNTGSINGSIDFQNVPNLIGGPSDDVFTFDAGASITEVSTVGQEPTRLTFQRSQRRRASTCPSRESRASAARTLRSRHSSEAPTARTRFRAHTDTTFNVTSLNAGNLNGEIAFSNFAILTGGSGNDTFKFANGATITGSINGGGGVNTLDDSAYTTTVTANLPASRATAVGGTVSNVQAYVGGSASNNLVLAPNSDTTFNVTSLNAGNLNGEIAFSNFAILTGGSGNDTFKFANGATITGSINGGGGVNTLDDSAYTTTVTANLPASRATAVGGTVSNVQAYVGGSASNNLVLAPNTDTTFNVTSLNAETSTARSPSATSRSSPAAPATTRSSSRMGRRSPGRSTAAAA